MEKVVKMSSENGILIFSKSNCCLSFAVQTLFERLGTHPCIYELDHDQEGKEIEKTLTRMGCSNPVPTVFINGNLVGSTNDVMSLHLSGSLIPLIRPYQVNNMN